MRAAPSGMVWKRIRLTRGAGPQYPSQRSKRMLSLRLHSTIRHGPVPRGRSLSASTPCLMVYALGTSGSRPSASQSMATGSLVCTRTVASLTFSQRVTIG